MTLTLVSDPAQSIYGWRSAKTALSLNYPKLAPDRIKEFTILKNYRTPKQLVDIANEFRKEFDKHGLNYTPSIPHLPDGENVLNILDEFTDPEEEMNYILREIKTMHLQHNIPYSQFSVICRTNNELLSFESGVVSLGIPYYFKFDNQSIMSQTGFKFLYSVYTLMVDPTNFLVFADLISPIKGIGSKFVEKIKHLHRPGVSVFETFSEKNVEPKKDLKQWSMLFKFVKSFLLPIMKMSGTNTDYPTINRTILQYLNNTVTFEDDDFEKGKLGYFLKRPQLLEILNTLRKLYDVTCEDGGFKKLSYSEQFVYIYENLQLSQDTHNENKGVKKEERDALGFYTIHSYKGKENNFIYYARVHGLWQIDAFDFENTCVFYVAITRSKKKLTLTGSQTTKDYAGVMRFTNENPFLRKLKRIVENY